MITVRCESRHELEGHLRTLAIAWGASVDGTRAAHGAARIRLARAMRLLSR